MGEIRNAAAVEIDAKIEDDMLNDRGRKLGDFVVSDDDILGRGWKIYEYI